MAAAFQVDLVGLIKENIMHALFTQRHPYYKGTHEIGITTPYDFVTKSYRATATLTTMSGHGGHGECVMTGWECASALGTLTSLMELSGTVMQIMISVTLEDSLLEGPAAAETARKRVLNEPDDLGLYWQGLECCVSTVQHVRMRKNALREIIWNAARPLSHEYQEQSKGHENKQPDV